MKTYDLLLIKNSGEIRFKRLSTNDISGIVDLFKEHDLLDDVSSMYFIQITIQDEKDILKLKNSFKLVGDSLDFCNILTEGNILVVYKKALEKEMMDLISKQKFEDAVELKTTSKTLTAIINSENIASEVEDFDDDFEATALYPYGDNNYAIQIISKTKAKIKSNMLDENASSQIVDIYYDTHAKDYVVNFDNNELHLSDFDFVTPNGYEDFLNLEETENEKF